MKTILTILMMVLAFNLSNAQTITFDQIDKLEKRAKGNFTEYVTSRGDTIRVGAKIKLGSPSNANNQFVYILESMGALSAFGGTAQYAGITSQGWESEVLKIRIVGNKRRGFVAYIISKTEIGLSRYMYDYEKALSVGEILSGAMTRSEAIAKLKEAKELLDLDIITQEDYNEIRAEVIPIITRKN